MFKELPCTCAINQTCNRSFLKSISGCEAKIDHEEKYQIKSSN